MPTSIVPLVEGPRRSLTNAPKVGSSKVLLVPKADTHYSPTKILTLHAYCSEASPWRVVAVLFLVPVPALVGSLLPSFVPLKNPLLGFAENRIVLVHSFIIILIVSFGTILLTLGATSTPRYQYPETKAFVVAFLTTLATMAFVYLICSAWMFPVPFFDLVLAVVWIPTIWIVHCAVLRDEFKRYPELAESLLRCKMPLVLQTSQFGVYVGLIIIFERLPTIYQIVMMLVFPVAKFGLKRLMTKYTRALEEMSCEVACSTVEICASLYQSMIMQTAPSTPTLCAIMGVDAVQGFLAIRYFVGRNATTPHREIMPRAAEILQKSRQKRLDAPRFSTMRTKLEPADAAVVEEALELASAVDQMLLIECIEVSVPVVNALFLLSSYRSMSTLYNTQLNRFFDNAELTMSATQSVLLYSLLQGVSLVVFHVVLRRRHDISALQTLALVLEYHMRSIQGKLLVIFPVLFYFTLLHYGSDFTLRFSAAKLMQDMRIPSE